VTTLTKNVYESFLTGFFVRRYTKIRATPNRYSVGFYIYTPRNNI